MKLSAQAMRTAMRNAHAGARRIVTAQPRRSYAEEFASELSLEMQAAWDLAYRGVIRPMTPVLRYRNMLSQHFSQYGTN